MLMINMAWSWKMHTHIRNDCIDQNECKSTEKITKISFIFVYVITGGDGTRWIKKKTYIYRFAFKFAYFFPIFDKKISLLHLANMRFIYKRGNEFLFLNEPFCNSILLNIYIYIDPQLIFDSPKLNKKKKTLILSRTMRIKRFSFFFFYIHAQYEMHCAKYICWLLYGIHAIILQIKIDLLLRLFYHEKAKNSLNFAYIPHLLPYTDRNVSSRSNMCFVFGVFFFWLWK